MIAEIQGKVNSENSNLTERSEDELTGNFFGSLRYLPFNRGLNYILKSCVYPAELADIFDSLDVGVWHDNILFWPREKRDDPEPDVILSFDNTIIMIEVKFRSGLSSDDEMDNSTLSDTQKREESCNQLAREGRLLERIAGGKDKILLLLAPEASAHKIYSDVSNRKLLYGVQFGYITWQRVFDALGEIEVSNPYEQVIVDDLAALLHKKGFEGFRNFNIDCAMMDKTETWTFDYSASYHFSFAIKQSVERGLFYEFG